LEKGKAVSRLPVFVLTGLLIAAAIAAPAGAAPAGVAIAQLNEVRQANGLAPLRQSPALARSSTRYARQMVRADFFGHSARIAVSSEFGRAGETLALHNGWTPQAGRTIVSWMNSPGHRSVLLSSNYRWVGMGLARGRIGSRLVTVWVAHVGARR
jgi:uncharacterized protein YkwD